MKIEYFNTLDEKKAYSLITINPSLAKTRYENYIEKYYRDYYIYPYYIKVLIMLGEDKKAIEVLNNVKNMYINDLAFLKEHKKLEYFERFIKLSELKILSYQERYEEFYNFYYNNFYKLKDFRLKFAILYCKSKMEILDEHDYEENKYFFQQIIKYDEQAFLKHTKKHLFGYAEVMDESMFVSSFPINEVIKEVKKYIGSGKQLYIDHFIDEYVFKYDGCGRSKNCNKVEDYFKVFTFHNTDEIFAMYPVSNCQYLPYIDLNYLISSKEDNKVKRMTQIEKFNKRYQKK